MSVNRWFIRCKDCLGIAAVETEPTVTLRCECGGQVESMGRVHKARLTWDKPEAPCDGRCTNALGPRCECKCKCENHGAGRVVVIQVDAGGIPRVKAANPERGAEFRAALVVAKSRLGLGGGALWGANRRAAEQAISSIRRLRTHKTRMEELAGIIENGRW